MKQKIEIEVDVPEGHKFSHANTPSEALKYQVDGQPAKACYSCIVFVPVEPKRKSLWLNVYPDFIGHIANSKYMADSQARETRVGQVRFDFADNKLVAVSLEPLSEEGA